MIDIIVNIVVYGTSVIFIGVIGFLYSFSKAYGARK